jgi:PAS domain S-box-containing protein
LFIGKNYQDVLPPELTKDLEIIYKKAHETKQIQFHEYAMNMGNDQTKFYEARILAYQDNKILNIIRDITEKKEYEVKIKESEEKYRLLFNTLTEAVALNEIVFDDNGEMIDYKILEVNSAFYHTADYNADFVIGNYATKLYGLTSEYINAFWQNHKEKLDAAYTEMLSPFNNKYFYIATSPFFNNLFVTTFFDITERKKNEDILKENAIRMQNVIEGTNTGTWEWNVQTGETKYNERWAEILGYTLEELEPVSIKTWMDLAHPEDLTQSEVLLNEHFEGRTDHYAFDARMKHKNGSWVWVYDRGKVIDWDKDGKPLIMYGTHTDITERKRAEEKLLESEQRYKTLIDRTPEAIAVHRHGKIIYVNPTAVRTIGADSMASLVGMNMIDFIHPDDRTAVLEQVKHIMSGGIAEPVVERRIIKLDGTVLDIELKATLINYDSEPAIQVSMSDITERKEAELEIKKKNQKLAELIASKDKFFSIIAHDLKSPLSGFLGLSKMMSEEFKDFTMQELQYNSSKMHESATNLYKLLDNLLEWSRIQRNLTEFEPTNCILSSLVKIIISLLNDVAQAKEIEILNFIPENIHVNADNHMLNSIIRNLLTNAIKFTEKNGRIDIGILDSKDENAKVCVYVKDSGIGMNQELIADLFDLNTNVSRKGTDGEPSTGLGLILCKEFVEKHGGRIWTESEVGKGSTFYFTLAYS